MDSSSAGAPADPAELLLLGSDSACLESAAGKKGVWGVRAAPAGPENAEKAQLLSNSQTTEAEAISYCTRQRRNRGGGKKAVKQQPGPEKRADTEYDGESPYAYRWFSERKNLSASGAP